jgi:hypothetical protein
MSRPKPNVLLEYTNKKNYRCEQILDAEAIWAVFYKENPFNLKSSNALTNYPGHAHNLASKLNELFNCSDFKVYKLQAGDVVTE